MSDDDPGRGRPELVSVIIATLRGATTIQAQLDALATQTYRSPYEVIVSVNGPDDGTGALVAAVAKSHPEIDFKIIDSSATPGTGAARNAALRAARGDFIVATDDDDVAADGWIEAMAAAATDFDMLAGAVETSRLNTLDVVAGRPPKNGVPTSHQFLPYAAGCNFGAWKDVLTSIGGWDEAYRGGGEDIDICWRAQLAGYTLGFAAEAVVHYRFRPSLGGLLRQMHGYGISGARLQARFRHSLSRRRLATSLRVVGALLTRSHHLLSARRRTYWLSRAALITGRVQGSIRHRVWYV